MKRRERLAAHAAADRATHRATHRATRAEAPALFGELRARLAAEAYSTDLLEPPLTDGHDGAEDCALCRLPGDLPGERMTLPDGSTLSISVVR